MMVRGPDTLTGRAVDRQSHDERDSTGDINRRVVWREDQFVQRTAALDDRRRAGVERQQPYAVVVAGFEDGEREEAAVAAPRRRGVAAKRRPGLRDLLEVRAVGVDRPDRRAALRPERAGRHVGVLVRLKRDATTIRRPRRIRAGGRDLPRLAATRWGDPDAAVRRRVERNQPRVRRPRRLNVLAAVARQGGVGGLDAPRPDVDLEAAGPVADIGDRIALRRDRRVHVETVVRRDLDRASRRCRFATLSPSADRAARRWPRSVVEAAARRSRAAAPWRRRARRRGCRTPGVRTRPHAASGRRRQRAACARLVDRSELGRGRAPGMGATGAAARPLRPAASTDSRASEPSRCSGPRGPRRRARGAAAR